MFKTDVVVVGGGQAGLALSHCLSEAAIDHVVLESGEIGERWRGATWDSLRLLTPNWLNALPGMPYLGAQPDGFMGKGEVIDMLERYAMRVGAPICTRTQVLAAARHGAQYVVATTSGIWRGRAIVVATGHCQLPSMPFGRHALGPTIASIHASEYRSPQSISGPVLVVGASSSGVQIADELARHGADVTLSVGRHTRLPRTWRGRDIFWWMARQGLLSQRVRDFHYPEAALHQPSLQLAGRPDRANVDLTTLQALGVRLTGRIAAIGPTRIGFAADLEASIAAADTKQARLLSGFDAMADRLGVEADDHAAPVTLVAPPPSSLAIRDFRTVIWATGYRRSFPWLDRAALNAAGEIEHVEGIGRLPGLYALGFRFLRKRDSNFIGGVGADAAAIADEIAGFLNHRQKRAG